MEINGHVILADTQDILIELKRELALNGIDRFARIVASGRNYQTNCPFHKDGKEKKPSFGINKQTGECHCFGCGWSGTFTEMISNCFGKNDFGLFGEKWLVKNFLSVAVESRPELNLNINRDKIIEQKQFVSEAELDSYRYYHDYMYERKLTNEIIEMFDIGYDKETDCITFNCRNKQGNTLFVAKRSVKTKFFHYPNNVEKQVYGIYELYSLDKFPSEVYICESMLDALVFWTHENKYACALNGLGTELQFKQLREMPCRKFILATDMDEAGLKARKKLRKELSNKLITEVFFPHNKKDANECTFDELENLVEVF